MYSTRITSKNDRYIQLAEKAIEGSVLARIPGAFWVEYLPFLRYIPAWVPGSSARKWGDLYKPIVTAARNEPYNAVEQAMVSLMGEKYAYSMAMHKVSGLSVVMLGYKFI